MHFLPSVHTQPPTQTECASDRSTHRVARGLNLLVQHEYRKTLENPGSFGDHDGCPAHRVARGLHLLVQREHLNTLETLQLQGIMRGWLPGAPRCARPPPARSA